MNFPAMLKLFFLKRAFVEAELTRIEKLRVEGKAYPPASEFRPEAERRVKEKRKNLLKSFIWVLCLVTGGAALALVLNKQVVVPFSAILAVRAVSVFCIAWAVWSKLGDIETWKHETMLEKTSQYLWKFFYSVGVFLGSLALFLVDAPNA